MITANELRIGNLVDFFGKIKTVIRIGKENSGWYIGCADNQSELMNCWNVEDAYEPIPLTEEWLLKFGFGVSDDEFTIIFYTNKPNFCVRYEGGIFNELKYELEIKYVHQLQNLYFALTGEELEVVNEN